jgi:hypothetical protein
MPKGKITKDEFKCKVLQLKNALYYEKISYTSDPKSLADKYLNMVLDKLNEYRE